MDVDCLSHCYYFLAGSWCDHLNINKLTEKTRVRRNPCHIRRHFYYPRAPSRLFSRQNHCNLAEINPESSGKAQMQSCSKSYCEHIRFSCTPQLTKRVMIINLHKWDQIIRKTHPHLIFSYQYPDISPTAPLAWSRHIRPCLKTRIYKFRSIFFQILAVI